jgi:hypothetical protein
MSDAEIEDTNDTIHDDAPAPAKERKPKLSPFLKALRDNQVAQAREALMQTVCERADDTIGSIFDALENDEAGDYIMLEVFKGMTVEELVRAAAPMILGQPSVPPASASADDAEDADDEDDDLDDDNEFDDDGSLEDDEPEPPKTSRKRTSKKKTKSTSRKKAPPKKSTKSSGGSGGGVSTEYQKKILTCLKEGKARNEESAISGSSIRTIIGGTDVEFRANMSALFEKGKVVKFGKARGTKYARAPRQTS